MTCPNVHTLTQNINLFMETSEEEFAKFLQTFVVDVWGLLMKVSLRPGQVRPLHICRPTSKVISETSIHNLPYLVSPPLEQDNLVMAAIRFLTTVSRSVHYTLFSAPGVLQQICEKVIVPNVRTRPEDEEVRQRGGPL